MPSQPNPQSDDHGESERDDERRDRDRGHDEQAPEDRPGEPGAEGGSNSPTRDKLPGMPEKDDPSPVGDTDQHSTG
ncbi:MAG: hypothetical protein ACRDPM_10985 [Solirubrobacteraceae bacterium]